MREPWFSVVVSVYNRPAIARRCLESCLNQSFRDYEVVVVDDGSSDETPQVLAAIRNSRLKIHRHVRNRGLCAARDSGVRNASGRWIVTLDSDHGLLPGALDLLFAKTSTAAEEVGAVGTRYQWDTGGITPAFVPNEAVGLEGFIRWCEAGGGTDYVCCYRRPLYGRVQWPADRRGPLDMIFQLDLARATKIRMFMDVTAIEYSDAPLTQTRSRGARGTRVLLENAPGLAWQYDEILRRHGPALASAGPRTYRMCHRLLALNQLLAGRRAAGARSAMRYLTLSPRSVRGWAVLGLGLLDRRLLAFARSLR